MLISLNIIHKYYMKTPLSTSLCLYFFSSCDRIPCQMPFKGERMCFDLCFKGMVSHGVTTAGTWSSWSHVSTVRRQRVMIANAQFVFSLHSLEPQARECYHLLSEWVFPPQFNQDNPLQASSAKSPMKACLLVCPIDTFNTNHHTSFSQSFSYLITSLWSPNDFLKSSMTPKI